MKTFKLMTQGGEVIKKFNCEDYEEAVEYFSKIKRLKRQILLRIFKVIHN